MADDNKIIAEILVEGVDQFKASLKGAQTSVENLNAEVAQTGDVSKQAMSEAAQSTASYRTQLKNMTSDLVGLNLQLAEMKDAGKAGTKEFTDLEKRIESLRKKAGELKDAMMDANDQIKATGSDTAGLDKAIRVVGSASAAFQVFEGAATLAGKGSEDLQKALVRLNGVMAITQGLQQIQNELVRDDSVFKGVATGATRIYTAAQNTLAKATGLVRVALAGLGIGAVIGLVYALVSAYKAWKGQTDELVVSKEKLIEQNKEEIENLEKELKFRQAIGEITEQGAVEQKVLALKKQQAQAANNLLEAERKLSDLQNQSINSTGFFKRAGDAFKLANAIVAQKKAVEEANVVYKEQTIALAEAQAELDKYEKTEKKTVETTKELEEKFGGVNNQLKRQPSFMREAIDLFNEYGRVTARSADQAEAAAKRITAAQDAIQESVSGGNVTRATGSQTRDQELEAMFKKAQEYYSDIQGAITQSLDLVANASVIRADKEIEALDKKRERGLISEKQYEKEVAKIKNEQARKTKLAQTIQAFAAIPLAILNALTSVPFPANIAAAAIVGALATAQAAIVAAAPLPKFRDGGSVAKRLGLIKGKSHEAGGVPIEVEGDEFVMSKKAVKHYGVDFMDKVNNMKLSPVVTMSPKLEQMKQTDYKLYEHLATLGGYMKQDYRTNETGNRILLNIQETLKRTNTYV